MNHNRIMQELEAVSAVITNSHVVNTSGKHGSAYVNKDAIYPHTILTRNLCEQLAHHFIGANPEVVVAPAVGGVILSQWVAYHLTMLYGVEVYGVYAEKEGTELASSSYGPLPPKYEDNFVIKRGYPKFIEGKRVLVVEDVITTDGSVKKVVERVRWMGGNIVGVGALCNRGGVKSEDLEVPSLYALLEVSFDAWDEADCPLCKSGVPINQVVGKGREYLKKKQG